MSNLTQPIDYGGFPGHNAGAGVPGSTDLARMIDLASLAPVARNLFAGTGLTGGGDLSADRTFNVGANADGSIVVNANDVQVGILATDAQHGNRGGGALHAVATSSVAGFMSAVDKTKLDGLPAAAVPATRTLTAGAGLTGGGDLSADRTFNVGANADGSIVVNADDVQVGVLATDAQHGNRGGGGIHALATTLVAGFMSAADKIKLNGLPTAAVPTSTQVIAGAGLTGGGDLSIDRTLNVACSDGTLVVNADDVQRAAITGDVGVPAGSTVSTLATVLSSPGTFGDASHSVTLTINGKGLVTLASAPAISINASAVASGNLAQARLPVASTGAVLYGRAGGGYDSDTHLAWDVPTLTLSATNINVGTALDVAGPATIHGFGQVFNGLSVARGASTNAIAVTGGAPNDLGSGTTSAGVLSAGTFQTATGSTLINAGSANFGSNVGITGFLVTTSSVNAGTDVLAAQNVSMWGHGGFVSQPTVTGSRGGNAALASLLSTLAVYGNFIDGTTP